jgi:hypothetical protein
VIGGLALLVFLSRQSQYAEREACPRRQTDLCAVNAMLGGEK